MLYRILAHREENLPVRRNPATAALQQLDGRNFQRVALHISTDVHA